MLFLFFWKSSLVKLSVKGDFNVGLKVLTFLENFDSSFDEQDLMDVIYDLDMVLEEIEDDKSKLLYSLKEVVSKLTVD